MREVSVSITLVALSFVLSLIWGGPLIKLMRYFKIGKIIREDGPESHSEKLGTPTMGGFIILVPVIILTILLNAATVLGFDISGLSVLIPLGVMVVFSILGAIDDWEGIRGPRKGLGMSAKTKFLMQTIFALITSFLLKYALHVPELYWPGYPDAIPLGVAYIPIATIIIVGFSNAMNFTDGLDGLASLISITAFAAYGVISLMQGQTFLANFCFTIVGALLGFLWFNVHPAQLFMGDTGSLALGAALGTVALMTGHWLLLPLIAIIPVSEVLSVVLQIAYFKFAGGKRLFKMAPLHHHFELSGWSETQVVQRFWIINLLFVLIGIAISMVR
ncbi:MAG: phospho-N-acetylmuramoyl-pentapeptide-transferase [Anaerolineaceae bacterium]|jgi:phospho-N-acetylmuramoyl-pentapeptide-transferase|nr:MAG: phospho-N-acetylmuramoyl-pentapeptide-transferase [Anaerolineaceae bacterium]